jgi:hypothetical protein
MTNKPGPKKSVGTYLYIVMYIKDQLYIMFCESIRFMPPNALPQKKIRALLEDGSGGLILVQ